MTSGKKMLVIIALAILAALTLSATHSSLRHNPVDLAASAVWGS